VPQQELVLGAGQVFAGKSASETSSLETASSSGESATNGAAARDLLSGGFPGRSCSTILSARLQLTLISGLASIALPALYFGAGANATSASPIGEPRVAITPPNPS
jgi:hypothetical protein